MYDFVFSFQGSIGMMVLQIANIIIVIVISGNRNTFYINYMFYFEIHYYCKDKALFELMLTVPVNSHGHDGTLPPFYETFTQNEDVMTSKNCFKYISPNYTNNVYMYGWFDMNHFSWAGSDLSG